MKSMRAAIYKDCKLFLNKAGILAIVLPLILLFLLSTYMTDFQKQSLVQPFPIAVRDEDNTMMSRTLVKLMRDVDLFSAVEKVGDETDEEILQGDCVAVITIPKNFFYDMYQTTEENTYVTVTVNKNRRLESALFESMFSSVMDIIHSEWASSRAVYLLAFGEPLSNDQEVALFYEASELLLPDALGRQLIFDEKNITSAVENSMERRLCATILAWMILFLAISAAKTLPEEMSLGILRRFRSASGRITEGRSFCTLVTEGRSFCFLFSKWLIMEVLCLPVSIAIERLLLPKSMLLYYFMALLLSTCTFIFMTSLSFLTKNAVTTQKIGNLIVLFTLVTGGTLWGNTLQGRLAGLKYFSLSYYVDQGLQLLEKEITADILWNLLYPIVVVTVLAGMVLLLIDRLETLWVRSKRTSIDLQANAMENSDNGVNPYTNRKTIVIKSFLTRLGGVTGMKHGEMMGSPLTAILMIGVLVILGISSASLRDSAAKAITIAVTDEDQSVLSQQLVDALEKKDGIQLISSSSAEGFLTIPSGYGQGLVAEENGILHYESSKESIVSGGAREIIAGIVIAQRCHERVVQTAAVKLGRELTEREQQLLMEMIALQEQQLPMYYHLSYADGSSVLDPFLPSSLDFAAFAAFLLILTAGSWCATADGRLVTRRMTALRRGKRLARGSDLGALVLYGGLVFLVVEGSAGWMMKKMNSLGVSGLQNGEMWPSSINGAGASELLLKLCILCLFLLVLALFARAMSLMTQVEGRMDGLAPFLALAICLLGGSFMDLGLLSEGLQRLAIWMPTGAFTSAMAGDSYGILVLVVEGILLLLTNIGIDSVPNR